MVELTGTDAIRTIRGLVTIATSRTTAALIQRGHVDNEYVRKTMLEAADMLRTLKIVLEAKDEVTKL